MAGQRPHSSQPWDELDYFAAPSRHDRRKPIVRVVCPVCAALVTVNALDVEGTVETMCSKCENTTISINTDDDGRITGIEGWANTIEKKQKPPDMKMVGLYVLFGLLALLLLLSLMRPAVSNNPPMQVPAAAPLSREGAAPAEPVKRDLFAPEKN